MDKMRGGLQNAKRAADHTLDTLTYRQKERVSEAEYLDKIYSLASAIKKADSSAVLPESPQNQEDKYKLDPDKKVYRDSVLAAAKNLITAGKDKSGDLNKRVYDLERIHPHEAGQSSES